MSKAEEAAHAAYPYYWKSYPFETNKEARAAFIKGYEQAEKDIKDALLEWAKELRENARASRENPPSIEFDRYMEGKEKTISKFIDKLNSL